MSVCYEFIENGKVMSQKQLVEEVRKKLMLDPNYEGLASRLFSTDETKQDKMVEAILKIRAAAKKKGRDYEGVSHFLNQKHILYDGGLPTYLCPEYIEEEYIQHWIDENKSSGKSPDLLETEIRAQIADTALEKQMGILQHSLIQALFDNNGDELSIDFLKVQQEIVTHLDDTHNEDKKQFEQGKTLRQIITQNNPSITDQQIVAQLSKNAIQIYRQTTAKYPNAKFIAECELYGDDSIVTSDIKYKGIKGISDLIVIKEDGSVDIIDFKVASRYYETWCASKQYHTEYQLAMYRQLLAQHGIDGSKIGLLIQPIYLNKYDASQSKVEPIQDLMISGTSNKGRNRLNWDTGSFTGNVKYLVPERIKLSSEEEIQVNDKAMDTFHELIDYNPAEKSYSKEDFIKRNLHEVVQGDTKKWMMHDALLRRPIYHKDKEFFTKEGGYIDRYISNLKRNKNDIVVALYKAIEEYRQNPKEYLAQEYNFLNTKGKGQIQAIFQTIFGEFAKPYYKPLNIDTLIENGIIGYYNENTGSCHFVVITDQMLTTKYADGEYGSIFGNFYTNDEVRELKGTTVLPAECQYAEMLKVMHIINMVHDANPNIFKNKSIGSISVVNTAFGENNYLPIKTLMSVYGILCKKANIKDHFASELQVSDPWKDYLFQLELIENGDKEPLQKLIKEFKRTHDSSGRNAYQKIEQLIALRSAIENHNPKYKFKNFKESKNYDRSDPLDNLFVLVSELILYYQNIPIDPSGNFDKYGISGKSFFEILGMPFISNMSLGNRGIGNSLFLSSAENSPSPTLRALSEYYQIAFSHIREEFQIQHTNITDLTIPYISRHNSQAARVLSGIDIKQWEKLLVKDSKGDLAGNLMLINPYSANNLSNEDAEFLKGILWEINKYRFRRLIPKDIKDLSYVKDKKAIENFIHSNDSIIKLFNSGQYFELPLKRARHFERWRKVSRIGLFEVVSKEFDTLRDDFDLTQMHKSHRSKMVQELRKNATTMYNQYDLSSEDRERLIAEHGIYDFEIDLDLLALDVAFQAIRQDYYESVLQTTAACATVLHMNMQLTGIDRTAELETIDVRERTALKGESNIPEEQQDAAKVVSGLRKLNSVLALAFRPLQAIKELTFGQFTNYSRVLGTMGSSDKLSMKTVFYANKVIWGQSIGKWAKAFTSDAEIASYTLCESLNKIYGIANEDINQTVNTSMTNRHGVLANLSKYMYIFNSAPDYVNRLTLFVAKMMEDGCFEAHYLDERGNLKYDFKKDARFSELNKHGLNSNYRGEEYLKQKALYLAMCEQFQLEGRNFITYDSDGKIIYKEFDRAYTTKQRNSIKEVADMAYGYYDHETKSLADLGFFGLIYKQFQVFLTAKLNLWFKGRPSTKGDNTSQGSFKIVTTESGEKCYRRLITDDSGNIIDVKIVPESDLTEEEKNTLDYACTWEGDYVEGLVYSIQMTLHDLFRLDFNSIMHNKYRLGNVALALHDLLIGMLLFAILKWLFSGGTKKMSDIKPLQRVLVRAMGDVSPAAITSMNWEPGFYSTVVGLRDDALSLFSDDDPDIARILTRRVGAIRDWSYNED